MAESLTLQALEKDRGKIQVLIQQTQIQLYRLDGILGYINDNVKALTEEENKCLEVE